MLPLSETPARLGWQLRLGVIVFYHDAPSVTFSLAPALPGCRRDLAERGVVWDLWALLASVRRPGGYFTLTCSCGIASDAGLEHPILVSHPDGRTILWELDIKGVGSILEDRLTGDRDGFIRLVFARDAYEADIRAMLRAVQATSSEPVPVAALAGLHDSSVLDKTYPGIRHVAADLFEPTMHGDCDAEEFAALDADAAWPREPLFPPGTVLEIGLFGMEMTRIDGQIRLDWPERWFTRWAVLTAFQEWTAYFIRCHALRWIDKEAVAPDGVDTNAFVLLPGHDPEDCHHAGERFAETLQRSFQEGSTAPGVTVRYVRNDPPQTVLQAGAS